MRRPAFVGRHAPFPRRVSKKPANAGNHFTNMGEVAAHPALVEEGDRLALEDRVGKTPIGHVRPPMGPIDGEEAKGGQGQAIEMGIGPRHHLVRPFGGGIEGDRQIDRIGLGEGHFAIGPIDRTRRGVEDVARAMMPAGLQHRQEPVEIGALIGVGRLDRIAHPGLGGEMDDEIGAGLLKELEHRLVVAEIAIVECETGLAFENFEPIPLQGNVIIGLEIVETLDLKSVREQPARQMKADKARCSGDENPVARHRPSRLTPRPKGVRPGHSDSPVPPSPPARRHCADRREPGPSRTPSGDRGRGRATRPIR